MRPNPKCRRRAHAAALLLLGLSTLVLSSCATLSPEQQADNSETRFQQRLDGVQDPMKQR
jgi:outer membrane biogenesis lipoprotein LolB